MKISGKTKLLGVIGWPVEHSLSPLMHNNNIADLGIDYVYIALPVNPANVKDSLFGLKALGFSGVNVTIPHKQAYIEYMDEISQEVGTIGALNTIHIKDNKFYGYNTDAYGFIEALKNKGNIEVKDKNIIVLGAGGASRAITTASILNGAKRLAITDVLTDRLAELKNSLEKIGADIEIITLTPDDKNIKELAGDSDIVVNASPLGMKKSDPLPINPEFIKSGAFVFDAIYNNGDTELLIESQKRGCRILNGLSMLAYQGARSFEIWTGIKPNVEKMMSILKQEIGI